MVNLNKLLTRHHSVNLDNTATQLYDQKTFYQAFIADLDRAKNEVIIESPFITKRRLSLLMPVLKRLRQRDVKIIINTRHPLNGEDIYFNTESIKSVTELQSLGIRVLYTVGQHRKLALIDRQILWEGSLNILSYNDSCEIMRRINSRQIANQTISFLGVAGYY